MELNKYAIIYVPTSFGFQSERLCLVNTPELVKKIEIPQEATGFKLFYRLEHTMKSGNKIFTLRSLPFYEKYHSFFKADVPHLSLSAQLADMCARMPVPTITSLDNKIYSRLVEKLYYSAHPEIEDGEEYVLPSKQDFTLPAGYPKADLIEEFFCSINVDNQPLVLRSEPISKHRFFVGRYEGIRNGVVSFTREDGGLGLADKDDFIVDPSEIDANGKIIPRSKGFRP